MSKSISGTCNLEFTEARKRLPISDEELMRIIAEGEAVMQDPNHAHTIGEFNEMLRKRAEADQ